jgi:major type 1 subunit fimbrin (pilin)
MHHFLPYSSWGMAHSSWVKGVGFYLLTPHSSPCWGYSAIRNPQSAIRNPQSAIRNPQSAIRNQSTPTPLPEKGKKARSRKKR